jgi:ABC-type uncharacterized transport system auxiliary subunit
MSPLALLLAVATAACSLAGCALTDKADALVVRYFEPSQHPMRTASVGPGSPRPLHLGRLEASDHLRQKIVVRTSSVELASYEGLRWTEKPEEYVRRALSRALFEQAGLVHAVAGGGHTLDVEILAFEEVRRGEKRFAAVAMHFGVHDDRVVIDSGTVRVETPIASPSEEPEQLAEAMGQALAEATEQLAARVAATAGREAPAETPTATVPAPAPAAAR